MWLDEPLLPPPYYYLLYKNKKYKNSKKVIMSHLSVHNNAYKNITTSYKQTTMSSQSEEPMKEGQKKITPPPAEATRVFYESLYRQRPESKMALFWCIQNGVLEGDELKSALKKLERLE